MPEEDLSFAESVVYTLCCRIKEKTGRHEPRLGDRIFTKVVIFILQLIIGHSYRWAGNSIFFLTVFKDPVL